MKKLLLVLTLVLLAVSPLAAQDWWQWAPFPACSNGQLWVWSSSVGGMTCAAQSTLVVPAYAPLAAPAFTSSISVATVIERKVTNVTVADDAAGTKPAGAIPITTDFATCTCNDATGCTMSIAEPTPTSGYGRSLTIVSTGTGNCEFADSAGVTEIGAAVVLEPTSVLDLVYVNAAWHRVSTADNVP